MAVGFWDFIRGAFGEFFGAAHDEVVVEEK